MFHRTLNYCIIILFIIFFDEICYAESFCSDANSFYQNECARCHGEHGKGDGPEATEIPAHHKPRDLTLGRFKVGTCAEKLVAVAQYGGSAYGLSSRMPSYLGKPCGTDGPAITTQELSAVIEYMLSMSQEQSNTP